MLNKRISNTFTVLPYYYKQKKFLRQLNKNSEIEKRKQAFKPISFSRKFDVGKPEKVVITGQVKVSEFRKLFLKGYFPLKMATFANKDVAYWTVPLKKLPLWNIFPCLVEGLSDINEFYQRLSLCALRSILFMCDTEDVLQWIPNIILPLVTCVRTLKCSNVSKVLIFLSLAINLHRSTANTILPYMSKIFRPINYFFHKEYYKSDNVETEDIHGEVMALRQQIWNFFKDFELCCYPNEIDAYYLIKTLLPIYESRKFCDIKHSNPLLDIIYI